MKRTRTLRLAAWLATVARAAVGCGGSDSGGDTGEDSGSETEAGGESTDGGTEAGGEDVAAIRDSGTLRVGIKYDQPLFGVNSPSGVVGFDAEIAKLIGQAIFGDSFDPASNIQFVEAVSANREPFLEQGEVDIVAATLPATASTTPR